MRMSALFWRIIQAPLILFVVIALALSVFTSLTLRGRLVTEFTNRGSAIADSIAYSSVELLLNRDASTIQATIDQFVDTRSGVAYVFVVDDQGEFVAHTFAPGIPVEIQEIAQGEKDRTIARDLRIAGEGDFIDIASPILAGVVGYVHVGMNRDVITTGIRSAILAQVGLIAAIFVVAIVVTYIQANRISQPLVQLAGYARNVASGSAQGALQSGAELLAMAERGDEVGQLTRDFQQMVREISDREQDLERRGRAIAVGAELGRRVSTILDRGQLVQEVVERVRSAFGYYFVGICLFDQARERLKVVAGTGEAGRALVASGYSIPEGEGVVARTVETGSVVLVPDVSQDAEWRPNPVLPETRTELAAPIAFGDQVLGVLDVQHDYAGSLTQVDADAIRLIANQVAAAFRNAQLFAEAQAALARSERVVRRYVEESWDAFVETERTVTGYRHTSDGSGPAEDAWLPVMGDAVRQGELTVADGDVGVVDGIDGVEGVDGASLAIPLTSSGVVIGAVGLRRPDGGDWSEDELTLIRSVGEQVSQALETRRLFEVERRRAQREQILRQTTDRVRAQTDLDAVLRAAAKEMRRAVGATHAVIRLETRADPRRPGTAKPAEDTGD